MGPRVSCARSVDIKTCSDKSDNEQIQPETNQSFVDIYIYEINTQKSRTFQYGTIFEPILKELKYTS